MKPVEQCRYVHRASACGIVPAMKRDENLTMQMLHPIALRLRLSNENQAGQAQPFHGPLLGVIHKLLTAMIRYEDWRRDENSNLINLAD